MKTSLTAATALFGMVSALAVSPTLPAGSTSVVQASGGTVTLVAEQTVRTDTATVTRLGPAPAAAATTVTVVHASSNGFTCPAGYYLTYAVQSNEVPDTTLSGAQTYLADWATTPPGPEIGSNGDSSPGATRSWNFTNTAIESSFVVNEQLTNVIEPTSSDSNLEFQYEATSVETDENGSLQFVAAYKDLTIYEDSSGKVYLQLYENVCANNQQLAYQALPTILSQQLSWWTRELIDFAG